MPRARPWVRLASSVPPSSIATTQATSTKATPPRIDWLSVGTRGGRATARRPTARSRADGMSIRAMNRKITGVSRPI